MVGHAWVVISLISKMSKIWLFIRSGRGEDKKKHVREPKNCFTQYDSEIFFQFFFEEMIRLDIVWEIVKYTASLF